ncbi:MAG TPA: thioredoxin domain-containing protein [Gemmatimonadales bacterium]|jgi:protein-disulfide isomerase|nr:thioredoxin domain-containing protein [Gemmatimonadales bacterium]
MNRFYVVLAVLAVVLGVAVFALLKTGGGAPAAAAGPPPAVVDDGFRGYTLGSSDARVEITEYSDFECPFCANFATVQMPTIRDQLIQTGKVQWRYRDYPLPVHKYSRFAAHAAQCAGEQGKFWDMHDQLFYHHQWAQTGKDPNSLFQQFAHDAGLDVNKYNACMESGRYAARIEFSRQEGENKLVDGTPTFFINGKKFDGPRATSDVFKQIADSIIAHSPPKPHVSAGHEHEEKDHFVH